MVSSEINPGFFVAFEWRDRGLNVILVTSANQRTRASGSKTGGQRTVVLGVACVLPPPPLYLSPPPALRLHPLSHDMFSF